MLMRRDGSLNQRGRLLRTVAGLAVLAAALVYAPQAAAGAGNEPASDPPAAQAVFDTHTVVPGETLWDIALREAPAGADPQVAVQAIMDFNGMDSSALRAGEQILLPPLG